MDWKRTRTVLAKTAAAVVGVATVVGVLVDLIVGWRKISPVLGDARDGSWRALGVDVRGRSQTLRINYRTSHQIRRQADRLLPANMADVDGNLEERRGTVSVFNGQEPEVRVLESPEAECSVIGDWLKALNVDGFAPHEIGVFVRSQEEMGRALKAVQAAGVSSVELDERSGGASGSVAVGTIHRAKGLEFRAVSWPAAMTRSSRCNPALRACLTTRILRMCTTRSGTCSMWPALALGIGCS